METIICPKCKTENPATATICGECRINLRFALEHPEEIERINLEAAQRQADSTQEPVSQGPFAILGSILVGALALAAGLIGIVPLFVIGEGTGSGIAAFAVVSLVYALVGFALAKIDPKAWWVHALLINAPVTLLCLSGPSGDYVIAAMALISITMVGAKLGTRKLRTAH